MKKSTVFIIAVIMAAMVLLMTACGKSEFSCDAGDSKNIVITAQNAGVDAFFMSGSLEVAEGEKIIVEPALEKGEIVIAMNIDPENQSIEALPDWEGEPTLEFTISGSEPQMFEAQPGSYNISATVTEKATGSVVIKAE